MANRRIMAVMSFLLLGSVLLRAEGPNPGNMKKWQDKRLERMTKELGLSTDQQNKIKSIFEDQRSKMAATSVPQDRVAIHRDGEKQIAAILTDDQKPKYQKMLAEERAERLKRFKRQGGDQKSPGAGGAK